MRAVSPRALATSDSVSSSGSDSTLKQRMPSSSPSAISSRVLPTPEKMILSPGTPAARARLSSPSETTSMPAPRRARVVKHRLVGIGLHRVADERRPIGEGGAEDLEMPLDGGARIAIERRADFAGDFRQRHVFGVQRAVPVGEMVHGDLQNRIERERRLRRRDRRIFRPPELIAQIGTRRRRRRRRGDRAAGRFERPAAAASGGEQRQAENQRQRGGAPNGRGTGDEQSRTGSGERSAL